MPVKVDPVAPQPVKHVRAQQRQHYADGELQRLCRAQGNGKAEQQHGAAAQHQRQGVAHAPGDSQTDRVADGTTAGRERRHGGEMIGIEGMANAQEEAEQQDRGDAHRVT